MSCSSRVSRAFKGISDDSKRRGGGIGYVHRKRSPLARAEPNDLD
jgi:hypothetical protein